MSERVPNHRPRKRFGQNFLHDRATIDRIIQVIAPRPGQALVEIGPGQGALTYPLLRAAHAMAAVEMDRDLVAALRDRAAEFGALDLYQGDALEFDFAGLAEQAKQPLRIVGNLPYNISTPLLASAVLSQLSDLGVRIAIDDFGAGRSSLGYLARLPVDVLKIDKSFVLSMNAGGTAAAIVRSTIELGHNLGLEVIAEGVETEALRSALVNLRCDSIQGFLLGRAMLPGDVEVLFGEPRPAMVPAQHGAT